MAFEKSNGTTVPHATDYADLIDIVVAFAVGTGDWEIVADNLAGADGYIILKGLDYSGDKAIYVAIKKYANAGSDIYGWILNGYTGYTGAGFSAEPGAAQTYLPAVPLWNDEIPYWLSVNPRRIVLVAKVSGVYVACYLGLMLPYGSTGQWQYPLMIGGSNVTNNVSLTVPRYSDTSTFMSVPFIPASTGATNQTNLMVRTSSGLWVRFWPTTTTITVESASHSCLHGVAQYTQQLAQLRPNFDGKYPLRTLQLARSDTPDMLGIIDGVKHVPGYLLSSEDTITEGSDTYTVFQNTFRTTLGSFFALKES